MSKSPSQLEVCYSLTNIVTVPLQDIHQRVKIKYTAHQDWPHKPKVPQEHFSQLMIPNPILTLIKKKKKRSLLFFFFFSHIRSSKSIKLMTYCHREENQTDKQKRKKILFIIQIAIVCATCQDNPEIEIDNQNKQQIQLTCIVVIELIKPSASGLPSLLLS